MTLLGQRDPRYVVHYNDGLKTERMDRLTAKAYASMFGGKVVCIEPRFMDHVRKWIADRRKRQEKDEIQH